MRGAIATAAAAALLLGAAAGCGGGEDAAAPRATGTGTGTGTAPAADAPVTRTVAAPPDRPTLRQVVGQHMVFAYSGLTPPLALRQRIACGEAAGVILFARNIRSAAQVKATVAKLQAIKRPAGLDAPLLVMVDHEGGSVRRLPGPPAKGASQTPSPAAARAYGRAAGALLRGAGVNVDLAPVVDVGRADSALANEGRVYDDDAPNVIAKAGAFAQGLRAAGVAPVLKHFPGFGAASVNTDDAVARIDLPLATLRAVDLKPYERIEAPAVMLSTAIYPRVDPRPAAFSRRWATTELRDRLKFGGVTITDDLQAAAVVRYGSPAQLAYFATKAGVDLPLFAKDYATGARAAAGLEKAVEQGALKRADLQSGAARVLAWRADLQQPGR
ncbi:MAG TPA: glycoside hydrolase family 3 N-terminal domain-containing protein [Baekduia sp.]|uniref:glycoside hydrolase family 3 N-terminal domain-containing protein n=1 Tax=Baekduia sp. TaxID=2600305 RepID=UPI002D77174B|nr:glycoside hydrolase family 3 N-terminal domain-containing protein [Baekduia sp.]HET6505974.1 glycoside hydrolase family 3 N-terminal domain-containing protein [Baekduia sp.]